MEMLASCVEAEAEERHGCERPALRLRLMKCTPVWAVGS